VARSRSKLFVIQKHAASTLHYERWILVKTRDDAADARRNPVSTQPESVLSGRTIEQVADEEARG
jgi:hypothetical protein